MIIKMKMEDGENYSWRFHDCAREVQYSTVEVSEVPVCEELPEDCQDGISFECGEIVTEIAGVDREKDTHCLLLTFLAHDNKPHNLYTKSETYLLNDNGKTIERIA